MQKSLHLHSFFLILAFICLAIPGKVQAATTEEMQREKLRGSYQNGTQTETIEIIPNGNKPYEVKSFRTGGSSYKQYFCCKYSRKGITDSKIVSVTSSNPKVVTIDSEYTSLNYGSYSFITDYIYYNIHNYGTATITLSTKYVTSQIDICVVPSNYYMSINNISQISSHRIKAEWKKVDGCEGYIVERSKASEDNFTQVAKVTGSSTTTAIIKAPWNVEYKYRVKAYINMNNEPVTDDSAQWQEEYSFTAQPVGASIKSVKTVKGSKFKISWTKEEDATGYKLYYSNKENGKYKCVYTAKGAAKTSYTHKVKSGQPYYYYVITLFKDEKSLPSEALSNILPKKGKSSSVTQKKIKQYASGGQYSWNWASPDRTYYYEAGGKFYIVTVQGNSKLTIYTLNSKMKYSGKKTVSLGKFDHFGGFHQGKDGNFYVAVGFNNPKESDTKTVIKVKQYSSKWKLKKTCSIKGSASNSFKGITIPFDAGSCRMDMLGSKLYLFTSREMYNGHQSNISFEINTKTMTAKEANDSYTSHSFNQYVKFKGNDLYLVDHGDAYPRSVVLTHTKNYGSDHKEQNRIAAFKFQGEIGDNFTGATVDGMEVGSKNVLICGTSQPHNYKVKGIKGYGNYLKPNVYLCIVDRNASKSKVIWLTSYHPKKSKTNVTETRMVKLSDNRFAILYNTIEKKKVTMNYIVVDNNGKKIYSKKYKNIVFNADSQPILYNGYIQWIATHSDKNYKPIVKSYRIPVIF